MWTRKTFQKPIHDKMRKESSVTQWQYDQMIRMCVYNGDGIRAEQLFQEMLDNGFQPTGFTYFRIIKSHFTAKNYERGIIIMMEDINSSRPLMGAGLYVTLLWQIVASGDVPSVTKVIEFIKADH